MATRKQLDDISPTFCLVRWKHATINFASGGVKSCCHHSFQDADLSGRFIQIHDNPYEVSQRRKMLSGQKVEDCSYCWWIEKNDHASDRLLWSRKSWMAPFFEEVKKNIDEHAQFPSWVELNFSSVCNLKCIYCSPIFSTQWYQEIKEFGPYPTLEPFNAIDGLKHVEFEEKFENSELVNKFWAWFEKASPHIRLLKLTGGEPLLSRQSFEMLRYIKENPLPHLSLAINSNISVPFDLWEKFLNHILALEEKGAIKAIYLHPSIDSFGSRAEFIRSGLELQKFKKNLESFLSQTKASMYITCTLNSLALGGLLDLWKYLLLLKRQYDLPNRQISITTEILQNPRWLQINLLPSSFVNYLNEVIDFVKANQSRVGFNEAELEGLLKAKSIMTSPHHDQRKDQVNFARFVSALEIRRKSHFSKIFPELKEFREKCEIMSKDNSIGHPSGHHGSL